MRRMASVFKMKKTVSSLFCEAGNTVILTDFPYNTEGKMVYVFTPFNASNECTPIGFGSIVLTENELEKYVEFLYDWEPEYT